MSYIVRWLKCNNTRIFVPVIRDLRISFGARCRTLRDETGLSQEAFANSIGMDRSYYASIECGCRNVTLLNMAKIAAGFGVTLSELLRGVDGPSGR